MIICFENMIPLAYVINKDNEYKKTLALVKWYKNNMTQYYIAWIGWSLKKIIPMEQQDFLIEIISFNLQF